MADYFDPETGNITLSQHGPPSPGSVKNPGNIRAARAMPRRFRVLKNGNIVEATAAQKAVIRQTRLPAIKAARKAALAEEIKQRLALAQPDYMAAAAAVDTASTAIEVAAVSLAGT